jgi:hypothetical protein
MTRVLVERTQRTEYHVLSCDVAANGSPKSLYLSLLYDVYKRLVYSSLF